MLTLQVGIDYYSHWQNRAIATQSTGEISCPMLKCTQRAAHVIEILEVSHD